MAALQVNHSLLVFLIVVDTTLQLCRVCTSTKDSLIKVTNSRRRASYNDLKDTRLPEHFVCFGCRLSGNENYELLKVAGEHDTIMDAYRSLARYRYVSLSPALRHAEVSYRRAIKTVEVRKPHTATLFKDMSGIRRRSICRRWRFSFYSLGITEVGIWRRLETEGTCSTTILRMSTERDRCRRFYRSTGAIRRRDWVRDH
jgi:hypothetical protein